MDILQNSGTAIAIFIGAGVLAGNVWYGLRSSANKILKEEVQILREEVNACETKHQTNEGRISELEKKIENTVNIPLQKIADHMAKSNEIQARSNEILERLGEKI